jgi:hypothetical protein
VHFVMDGVGMRHASDTSGAARPRAIRIVRMTTGIVAFSIAAVLLLVGGGFAFGPDATDISEVNGDFRAIGFALLLVGAALGWVGWRLVRRRRSHRTER